MASINFAKLSNTAPRRRMAAALSGFGMGRVAPMTAHLRGLGFGVSSVSRSGNITTSSGASGSLLTRGAITPDIPEVNSAQPMPLRTVAPTTVLTRPAVVASSPRPTSEVVVGAPASSGTDAAGGSSSSDSSSSGSPPSGSPPREEYSYAKGSDAWIPNVGAEEADADNALTNPVDEVSNEGGGGSTSTRGGGGSTTSTKEIKNLVPVKVSTTTSQLVAKPTLMAQISALPTWVKITGGIALVYVAMKFLK